MLCTPYPQGSRGGGIAPSKVAPRRETRGRTDGELGRLRYSIALNMGGCTKSYADGVRRLCDGLLPLKAEIQSNPEQPETSIMQPHSNASGTDGGPGGIAFSDSAPGGFRFLSPCRKEQRDSNEQLENVHDSIVNGAVTRWLPQSLRDSSLPEGASGYSARIRKGALPP